MTADALEHWRPIPGYEGVYEVSDQYRVRSVERVIMRSNGYRQTIRPRIRRLRQRCYDRQVTLVRDGRYRSFCIHRLVEAAFASDPKVAA